jgi:AcrR family transcriptional regulator
VSTRPLTNSVHHRPGGRTADITRRIHDAVLALIISGGEERCTFQTVAKRAGIERSTLYRRYPTRWAMMSEAFAAAYVDGLSFEPTGSFRGDLTRHLSRVAHALGSPLGMAMLAAGAVARLDPGSREAAGGFWEFRKEQQRPFVQAAIDRGELAGGRLAGCVVRGRRRAALFPAAHHRAADRQRMDRGNGRTGLQGFLPYGPLSTYFHAGNAFLTDFALRAID